MKISFQVSQKNTTGIGNKISKMTTYYSFELEKETCGTLREIIYNFKCETKRLKEKKIEKLQNYHHLKKKGLIRAILELEKCRMKEKKAKRESRQRQAKPEVICIDDDEDDEVEEVDSSNQRKREREEDDSSLCCEYEKNPRLPTIFDNDMFTRSLQRNSVSKNQ